jgi:hypothetical protein
MVQPGFFDVDERLAALSAAGDPLVRRSKGTRPTETISFGA